MKQVENALAETVELQERSRELDCLHAALDPARTEELSLEELLQHTVDVIPLAFRVPEGISARASITQRAFVTKNFRETPWVLAQNILVRGQAVGALEVHFRDEASLVETRRLSKGKGHFLELLAARFGELVRRLAADEQIREEHGERLSFLEQQLQLTRPYTTTPIVEVWDKVLLVPVMGVWYSERATEIFDRLLHDVSAKRSQFVIIDLSGVSQLDSAMADDLLKWPRGVALLGVSCIITGISPQMAQTLVCLGIDYDKVKTVRSLEDGLRECLRQMGPTRVAGMIWTAIFRP